MGKHSAGKEIVMPALEMAQEHGLLVRWLKAEGEFVQKGEPLMEIETDKALTEIESPDSGTLSQISAQPGDEVPVGRVIAVLLPLSAGTTVPKTLDDADAQRTGSERAPGSEQEPRQVSQVAAPDPVPMAEGRASPRRILASPKARRLAAEANIDLNMVEGSGPGKAVLPEDVFRLSAQKSTLAVPEYTAIAVKGMRRTIAEKLQRSAQEAPHIALSLSVDMCLARCQLQDWNTSTQRSGQLALNTTSLICKALVASLLQHPRLNSHFLGDEIREYHAVHLGIAVALGDGLVVPVIRNAETKDLASVQSELADLTSRARSGRLQSHEMKASTFTLSNLGMFGVEQFTAILNPPEVGILSVGTILDTPVGSNGQVVLRPVMQMTVNADHRAVDGVVAARFISTLKKTLEDPGSLFT